ncbi:acyltransferase [Mucilaginibacter roseus]|uniref:Acyltransferase n=1 Tax=Mucilaginibacter roseus TaxID=1528868 RepID=A0ABS8U3U9_9SPHI|nr:acyltransferase [Mucilaginibacter roseus]MCD8740549.1 acyltransferase [Mucilaginibacter roseus]
MNKNERIFGLDLMRCIAILFVLFSHARFYLPIADQQSITVLGFWGVELFFVLSGFLIGGILIKTFEKEATGGSLKTFWVRRWMRTLPNYYLFIFINIACVLLLKPPHIRIQHLSWYFVFLQNFAWVKPSFFNVSWSLCIEEWFYMFYPLAVLFFRYVFKFSIRNAFLTATLLFIIVPIGFRFYCLTVKHYYFWQTRMIVISRLDAMMTGVFVAFLKFYHRKTYEKLVGPGAIIGAVIAAGLFVFYLNNNAMEGVNPVIQVFFLTVMTIAFALFLPACNNLKTKSSNFVYTAIYKISLWSYSIYLINFPVVYVLNKVEEEFGLKGGIYSLIFFVLFFALNLIISSYLYRFVEKPFLTLRDKYFKEEKPGTAVPATPIIR